MKALVVTVATLSLVLALGAGCSGVVIGSGDWVTEDYAYSGFNRLEVSDAFEVTVTHAAGYDVSVTADDNVMRYVEVSQEGDTLRIGLRTLIRLGPVHLKAEVGMPEIRGLVLSGASRGTISGFSSDAAFDGIVSGASSLELVDIGTGDLELDVSGASRVNGDITGDDADLTISGASSVQLEGGAEALAAAVSGASRLKLAAFPVASADVALSGASSGTVNIEGGGRLDADLSGASRLEYVGEAITLGAVNITGASTLTDK